MSPKTDRRVARLLANLERKLFVFRISAPAIIAVVLATASCAQKDDLQPLYDAKAYSFSQKFETNIPTETPMTVIKPDLIRQITGALFGWIPILGQVIQLPMNLASALLPTLKDVSHPELPANSRVNDPEILNRIDVLEISSGNLHIVPESQRGKGYRADRCWFWKCKEVGFSFLEELRLYIVFEKPSDSKFKPISVLIGAASRKHDYDEKNLILRFQMTRVNLKPYFLAYPKYHIDLVADAHIPEHPVYIKGGFVVHASFNIDSDSLDSGSSAL